MRNRRKRGPDAALGFWAPVALGMAASLCLPRAFGEGMVPSCLAVVLLHVGGCFPVLLGECN